MGPGCLQQCLAGGCETAGMPNGSSIKTGKPPAAPSNIWTAAPNLFSPGGETTTLQFNHLLAVVAIVFGARRWHLRLAYACSPGKENALFLLPPPPFGATIQGGLVRRDNLSSIKDHPQVNCRQVGNKHPQRGIAGAGAVPFTGANVTAMLLVARRDLPDQCWGELQGTGNRPVSHQ